MKTPARKLAQVRQWREVNREKVRASNRESYRKLRARRLADKRAYFQANKAIINLRRRVALSEDIESRIEDALRRRINHALKKQSADRAGRFRELVGCSPAELKRHIETLFSYGMTWDNRPLWHIDHIQPCCAFDLSDPEQQRRCFHFTNLQPLWVGDNLRKGGRVG